MTPARPIEPDGWKAEKDPQAWPNCDRPDPAHHVYIITKPDGDGGFTVVARMADYYGHEADKDAQLLAAAPALYAALREAVAAYEIAMHDLVRLADQWLGNPGASAAFQALRATRETLDIIRSQGMTALALVANPRPTHGIRKGRP